MSCLNRNPTVLLTKAEGNGREVKVASTALPLPLTLSLQSKPCHSLRAFPFLFFINQQSTSQPEDQKSHLQPLSNQEPSKNPPRTQHNPQSTNTTKTCSNQVPTQRQKRKKRFSNPHFPAARGIPKSLTSPCRPKVKPKNTPPPRERKHCPG